MKKHFITLLALATAFAVFTGCASGGQESSSLEENNVSSASSILEGSSGEAPLDSAGTQSASSEGAVELPNPFTPVDSVEEVKEQLGVDFAIPSALPDGYVQGEIAVSNGSLGKTAQVFFMNGEDKLMYRMVEGTSESNSSFKGSGFDDYITFITGDFNQYADVKDAEFGGRQVKLRGGDGKYNVAFWEESGFSFCLTSNAPLPEESMQSMIESIPANGNQPE